MDSRWAIGFLRPELVKGFEMRPLDIAVAGAGVGGLAVGALLRRAGHDVTVFDKFAEPAPVGSGLVVQPIGLSVLKALGADQRALELGNAITAMRGREADQGRRVLEVSYVTPKASRFGLAIHRAALFDALYGAAQAAGVALVSASQVTGLDGAHLLFTDRREGPFDLIIDASGAGSVLSPLKANPLGYGALWATVDWPSDTPLPRDELRQMYRRANRMMGVLPIGSLPDATGFKAAIFWSLPADGVAAWRKTGLQAWKDEAVSLWPEFAPFVDQITDPDQMTAASYTHGTLVRPYGDGIAYIGDAAHRASPQLGQGANMALLDAWALSQAIAEARSDVPLTLLYYARARRWHVWSYQTMSRLFTPQYQSDSRVLPVLRDRLLFPLSQVQPVPRILTRLVCGDMLPPTGSLPDPD